MEISLNTRIKRNKTADRIHYDQTGLEIGMLYKKYGHLYLAVSKNTFFTVIKNKPQIIKPSAPQEYELFRESNNVSVEELCDKWHIEVEVLDDISLQVLGIPKPNKAHLLLSNIISKRNAYLLNAFRWQEIRSYKISER